MARPSEKLRAGDIAPNFMLRDQKGVAVDLASFIAHGPVILAFHRGTW
jgi:peroxiredoxin